MAGLVIREMMGDIYGHWAVLSCSVLLPSPPLVPLVCRLKPQIHIFPLVSLFFLLSNGNCSSPVETSGKKACRACEVNPHNRPERQQLLTIIAMNSQTSLDRYTRVYDVLYCSISISTAHRSPYIYFFRPTCLSTIIPTKWRPVRRSSRSGFAIAGGSYCKAQSTHIRTSLHLL